jgi:hypothetical protein
MNNSKPRTKNKGGRTMTKDDKAKKTNKEEWTRYSQTDLDEILSVKEDVVLVKGRLVREMAGGIGADDESIKAFVTHHLGIPADSDSFDAAVARILKEEIGERDVNKELVDAGEHELSTKEVYQVKVIRQSDHGPFILEHMLKAMIKVAGTRMELFMKKRGSKDDIIHLGLVRAHGTSLQNPDRPWEIYLRNNGGPAKTKFNKIQGNVQGQQGKRSISHHTEVTEEGAEFEFTFRYPHRKLKREDIVLLMAAFSRIKLGSCLSLGYGEIEITELAFPPDSEQGQDRKKSDVVPGN